MNENNHVGVCANVRGYCLVVSRETPVSFEVAGKGLAEIVSGLHTSHG